MDEQKVFIAITGSNETGYHEVYFVNNSDEIIKSLEMNSGGYVTYDDDPVTLSSFGKNFGEIEPMGFTRIDSISPIYGLEGVNVYNLLITTETTQKEYSFTIGPGIGFMGNRIPIINKMGRRIYLG